MKEFVYFWHKMKLIRFCSTTNSQQIISGCNTYSGTNFPEYLKDLALGKLLRVGHLKQ